MKVKQNPGLLCKAALGSSGLRGSSDRQGAESAHSLVNLLFPTLPKSAHTLTSPLQNKQDVLRVTSRGSQTFPSLLRHQGWGKLWVS